MTAINSPESVCNLALGGLGNYGTITNITTPTNDKERTFALWYDILREFTLKLMMPNFALARKIVAQLPDTPAFGYGYAYEYPQDCLKVLGIGEAKCKQNNYSVEGNQIQTDDNFTDGLQLRYIKNITDVTQFSPEYKMMLAQYLQAHTCQAITQDPAKAKLLMDALPAQLSSASGLNAQENMPMRISNSRFQASRYNHDPQFSEKK